jgi:H+/gluconate symporter-like permease
MSPLPLISALLVTIVTGCATVATSWTSAVQKEWIKMNAASIAKCLHGSASSKGKHEILGENGPAVKARIYWSGLLGSEHYTDTMVTFSGNVATISVNYDSGRFSPNKDCRYLRGVAVQ